MYTVFFKENDTLREFMNFCVSEYDMIPDVSIGSKSALTLSKRGTSIGLRIISCPLCIKIVFLDSLIDSTKEFLLSKLVEYANKYNVVLGKWIDEDEFPNYQELGFQIVQKSSLLWIEYSQLLH